MAAQTSSKDAVANQGAGGKRGLLTSTSCKEAGRGRDRHGGDGLHRHAGAAVREADRIEYFLDHVIDHGSRAATTCWPSTWT